MTSLVPSPLSFLSFPCHSEEAYTKLCCLAGNHRPTKNLSLVSSRSHALRGNAFLPNPISRRDNMFISRSHALRGNADITSLVPSPLSFLSFPRCSCFSRSHALPGNAFLPNPMSRRDNMFIAAPLAPRKISPIGTIVYSSISLKINFISYLILNRSNSLTYSS